MLIRDGENHFLLDAFRGAFFQFGANPGRQTSLLSAYGYLIVNLVNDQLSAPARSPIVEEIENCIIGSYPDENFELDSYLQSLPFNYDYLRKLFQKEVGTTPHRFLSDTRLQAAAERLSFTDTESVSISEIAHFCGFREPLYFSRMFRKKYGLSPRAYQEALRGESNPSPDEGNRIEIAPSK
jgi:AraC-like DNA-binding protein